MIKGFIDFIREQGIVGLAVGFVLGGSVQKVVSSLVQDIINPVLGIMLGGNEALAKKSWLIGSVEIMWGDFLKALIDFLVIAAVVYFVIRVAQLNRLDKKKSDK